MNRFLTIESVLTITGRGAAAIGRVETSELRVNDDVQVVTASSVLKTRIIGLWVDSTVRQSATKDEVATVLLRGIAACELSVGDAIVSGVGHPSMLRTQAAAEETDVLGVCEHPKKENLSLHQQAKQLFSRHDIPHRIETSIFGGGDVVHIEREGVKCILSFVDETEDVDSMVFCYAILAYTPDGPVHPDFGFPISAPRPAIESSSRGRVAAYMAHVNYNLAVGNFEMDVETGEARVRTSQQLISDLDISTLMSLVYWAERAVARFWPEILEAA